MAGWRTVLTLIIVTGGTLALMAVSQADEQPSTTSSPDRITQLLSRIEQLERRVQALETKPTAIQQSTHAVATTDEWVAPASPVPQSNQPQFGIVYQLKRIIPETPATNQPTADGKLRFRSGGIEFNR